jgi:hypothetical protein
MEKSNSDIEKPNFNISEIIKKVNSPEYLEEEKDFSYEIIKQIDFNSAESVKSFLKEFTNAFKDIHNANHTVQTFYSEVIYEFLKNRDNLNFLDDQETKELFEQMLETRNSLQN